MPTMTVFQRRTKLMNACHSATMRDELDSAIWLAVSGDLASDQILALASTDDSRVSYAAKTETYEMRVDDNTRMATTLGRWLIRQAKIEVTDCRRRQIARVLAALLYHADQFTIREDVAAVYNSPGAPRSCMSTDDAKRDKLTDWYQKNGVRILVYSGANGDGITARALLWTIDGVDYVDRVYPSDSQYDPHFERWADDNGARIAKQSGALEYTAQGGNNFAGLVPYMDTFTSVTRAGALATTRDHAIGARLQCEAGSRVVLNSSGLVSDVCEPERENDPEFGSCANCGDGMHDHDDVVLVSTARHGEQDWCRHCVENDAYYCDGCDEWNDSTTTVHEHNSRSTRELCEACHDDCAAVCDQCQESQDDGIFRDSSGNTYCDSCVENGTS